MISLLRKIYHVLRGEVIDVPLLGRSLRVTRGVIRKEVDYDDTWFYALAKNSQTIFDIGANIGYTALLALVPNRNKSILLVDANEKALSIAAKNLLQNDLINSCRFYLGFVSNKTEEKVKFFTLDSGAAGSMFETHAKSARKVNSFLEVSTTTLDFLIKFYKIIPDLVKIDVEGAEHYVLEGGGELAKRRQTRFMVEMHSSPQLSMTDNANFILDWCKQYSYSAWYMKSKSVLLDAESIASRGKCHLLLQPMGWEYPQFLRSLDQSSPLPLSCE